MGYIYRCIGMNKALECSPNYPHTRLSTTRSHVRASDFRWGGRRGGGGIFYNVLRLRLSFQVVPDLCFRIILDLVSGLARAPWKCPRPRPSWSRSRSRPGGHQTALEQLAAGPCEYRRPGYRNNKQPGELTRNRFPGICICMYVYIYS